jgi:hypothetical protein
MRFAESPPVRPLDRVIIKGVHGDENVKFLIRMIFKVSAGARFLPSPLLENSEQRLLH